MERTALEKTFARVRDKCSRVSKLLENPEQLDTENEPYKTKYEAIRILKEAETHIVEVLENIDDKDKEDELVMLAIIHLNLGLLHSDTEQLKAGEEHFMKCIGILKGRELEPEAVIPELSALNQLGIIWSKWFHPLKAKAFLDQAEQIYNDYTAPSNPCKVPINMARKFNIEENEDLEPEEVLEKVHTLTLYYLAQVYALLKDDHKSAVYCYMSLQRQLGKKDIAEDLDYIDWALNAATLSQYFMENEGYSQARHHLAAASYILTKYSEILKKKTESGDESEALAADYEKFNHRSADVARCWAKYGLLLMGMSRERLLKKSEENEESQVENSTSKIVEELKFHILEKEIEPIANQVTDKYLLDFDDARPVFVNVQKWLDEAKTYYTLENHASDYVSIVQDMSRAYKFLAFFEEEEDRQAKMHKRRIDLLESVIKELNPQYYKSACREIWTELGETYSDILDIKLNRLRDVDEQPNRHVLAKINNLANNAIKNFQSFLDSIDVRNSNGDILQFSEEFLISGLSSYVHLGRLYNKIITPVKKEQLENCQNSLNAYKFVVDYCDKYPDATNAMKNEYNLSKEMVNLLTLKITWLMK